MGGVLLACATLEASSLPEKKARRPGPWDRLEESLWGVGMAGPKVWAWRGRCRTQCGMKEGRLWEKIPLSCGVDSPL